MPVITSAEVKTLLGISGSDYDARIAAWIPIVQDFILEYCGSVRFKDTNKQREDITIAFVENGASADTITDSDSEFVSSAEFEAGMDIIVEGSLSNDGVYTLGTVAAGTLTLSTDDDLVAESAGEDVTISRVVWPKGIKKFASQMIWENISAIKSSNVKAESVGDYSVTYTDSGDSSSGYSDSVLKGLNQWRVAKLS